MIWNVVGTKTLNGSTNVSIRSFKTKKSAREYLKEIAKGYKKADIVDQTEDYLCVVGDDSGYETDIQYSIEPTKLEK